MSESNCFFHPDEQVKFLGGTVPIRVTDKPSLADLLGAALADGWYFTWDLHHRAIWVKRPDHVSPINVDALGLSIAKALNAHAEGSAVADSVQADVERCECHRCIHENDLRDEYGHSLDMMRMILCPRCDNKRCPHASDHRLACTNSNDPGQPGSVFGTPNALDQMQVLPPPETGCSPSDLQKVKSCISFLLCVIRSGESETETVKQMTVETFNIIEKLEAANAPAQASVNSQG